MTKRKSKTTISPEAILLSHTAEVRAVAERLRQLVREAVPEATETAQPSWHSLNYRHPRAGYFCGLFPRAEDVLMVFEFGLLLPDPEGILEGEGKQVRFITLRRETDIRVQAIQNLLHAALALPPEKSVKLELIRAKAKLTTR
jgi:hypothetical protein